MSSCGIPAQTDLGERLTYVRSSLKGDIACATGKKRGRQLSGLSEEIEVKSPVMAMMPPTIMVATTSAPPVMMPAAAAMAPSMTTAMSMAAPDLDYGIIRHAKRVRRCDGHCRRRQGWS
jgi:hypothetical protein